MTPSVVLDTGVLGLVTHPSTEGEAVECKAWLRTLLRAGASAYVPEISDYELRRELLRLEYRKSILRLDALKTFIDCLPITTSAMNKAAEFWAVARGGDDHVTVPAVP